MRLAAGTRLGPYEILSAIGAGGMGEVYRAHDTKLGRDVALKVIPDTFALDPDRLARFKREAQVLASLNHPNIAAIHGFEDSGETHALVLELVEGETLADLIAARPLSGPRGLPLEEALPIAKQIAEALEAAHEQGIIHRDLKPANIKVTPGGVVKVLDFGLAKITESAGSAQPAAGSAQVSMSPTITSPAMMTGVGVLLGTAAYMSPEQAKGRPADKRSDVWAFGCVLYEMLTGKRPFEGETISDVLAKVIEREPDFAVLPATTPPAIRRLLRRSLEKDRKQRLPDTGIARIEIDEALSGSHVDASQPTVAKRGRLAWILSAASLLIAAVAIAVAFVAWRAVPEPVVTRLDVTAPSTTDGFSLALSPNGRQIVFVGNGEKGSQLWLRALDQVTAQPLAGTKNASYPFWAPDGRSLGFFAEGKLKRLDLSGGSPQVLADAGQPRGGTWNADGVIVFAPTATSGLMRMPATGGNFSPVTHVAPGHVSHRWPQFLPDGRRFIFLISQGQAQTHGIYVASLDGGEPTRVVAAETSAAFAPPGYLVRVSQGVLMAQAFDMARATVSGDPFPVAQGVGADDGAQHSAFSISSAGVLAYRPGAASVRQMAWVDRTGKVVGKIGAPDEGSPANLALAPDGQRIAFNRTGQNNIDVWLIDARGVATRFTFDAALDTRPIWSPDGTRVVFQSTRTGPGDLFEKQASGAADERPLLVDAQAKTALDWSSDGRFLLYSGQDSKNASDLWALPLTGERKSFPVVQTSFDDIEGQFSPDGRWVAYASNESGRYETYVRPFPGSGGKWQVSTAGGTQPRWSPDGKEIDYVSPDNRLMAAPIHVAPDARAMELGAPLALFPIHLAVGGNIVGGSNNAVAQYAVGRDGRFLMITPVDDAVTSPITIVLNWAAALKK